jgi:hypothetical protein
VCAHTAEFGQNSLANTVAGFAAARFAPSASLCAAVERRIADLRRPPRTGFTEPQEERLALWARWRREAEEAADERPAMTSSC